MLNRMNIVNIKALTIIHKAVSAFVARFLILSPLILLLSACGVGNGE